MDLFAREGKYASSPLLVPGQTCRYHPNGACSRISVRRRVRGVPCSSTLGRPRLLFELILLAVLPSFTCFRCETSSVS